MKKKFLLIAALFAMLASQAQTDTAGKNTNSLEDTIRVGNMVIVRNTGNDNDSIVIHTHHRHPYYKPSNISTNWVILDLGFANYADNTNYPSGFAAASTKDWFNLRTGKSVDVNIWLFMQRLNVIKHVVNLKYGLGIELNNYRYSSPVLFSEDPSTQVAYDLSRHYKKNKLAADYVTVPLMLNFNFTPHRREGFGISFGASAGYLYSSRQKVVTNENGKQKKHDDFDLDPWKISWIGEIQLGFMRFYGSYATKSMFKQGLDQIPYTVGIRFSNW
ncbi:MAG: outer membrane beta-barrel protein [Bacteroidetes bacterium]|nr:outer membrane beta-barrel protein [Bacteroidota bacterium]MBS1974261.1 outer membrane beta-barrel protein [Bacteroidota bacterium]